MDTLKLLQVVLGRRLLGVFMTIYMPTILMNIVGHCTMYFKPFFFEAQVRNITSRHNCVNFLILFLIFESLQVSVNLTVMLVLTTMFVRWILSTYFLLRKKVAKSARPSVLCVTHQMSSKNTNYVVGSTVRYGMMNYKVSVYGVTGWYFVVLGQYGAVLIGIWWYWISTTWD